MTVNNAAFARVAQVEALSAKNTSYQSVTLNKYLSIFDTGGAATGNDVVGLWAQSIAYINVINDAVNSQNAAEMQQSWLTGSGDDVATIRADFVAIVVSVETMLDLIETNQALFLDPTMNRVGGNIVYPSLTAGQRAAVKSDLDAINALIVS